MSDQDPEPPVTSKLNEPNEQAVLTRLDDGTTIAAATRTGETQEPHESEGETIISPFVGTCYLQPRPGEPPFVKVGDVVKVGRTVCVIESMILFNEVEAEFDCVIEEVLVSNGQPVEYGTKLFRVRSL
jgi:acetyl-CoA carboxylase biotin carboxyl carrier protein